MNAERFLSKLFTGYAVYCAELAEALTKCGCVKKKARRRNGAVDQPVEICLRGIGYVAQSGYAYAITLFFYALVVILVYANKFGNACNA